MTVNTHAPYVGASRGGRPFRWGCQQLWERGTPPLTVHTNLTIEEPTPQPPNYTEPRALRDGVGSIARDHRSADRFPSPRSPRWSRRSARLASNSMRYARELRCADSYVEAVYQLLERTGRLRDTTLLITADHGEGFMQSHMTDIGHGGAIYDTQSHVPFLLVGAAASELPEHVAGVWSETTIAHTVLDLLGLPSHPLVGSPLIRSAVDTHRSSSAAAIASGLQLSTADLLGQSLLEHWRDPPDRAFMACAFESSCIGLRKPFTKWVYRLAPSGNRGTLEVYYEGDTLEEEPITSGLRMLDRQAVVEAMRRWVRAVNHLHEGEVIEDHTCPYDSPHAHIPLFDHYTHCCPTRPGGPHRDDFGRVYTTCPGAAVQCSTPPCKSNRDALTEQSVRAAREQEAALVRLRASGWRPPAEQDKQVRKRWSALSSTRSAMGPVPASVQQEGQIVRQAGETARQAGGTVRPAGSARSSSTRSAAR